MSKSYIQQFFGAPVRATAAVVILIFSMVSIFAYVFTTDKTPDINEQIPAIGLKEAGFSIPLLKLKTMVSIKETSWLQSIFMGSENTYRYIPLAAYNIKGDSVIYKVYEDEADIATLPTQSIHIASLVSGIDPIKTLEKTATEYVITDLDDHRIRLDIKEALAQVTDTHIEKRTYWLGTDLFGRSLLDRIILGIRYSLFIGFLAVLISITIGAMIGMIAGYYGGKVDEFLSYVMNVFWSIPTLILVFAIVLVMGRGMQNIFIAVGLTMWVDAARLVRGQVLSLKKEKYIESVKTMGMGTGRIMLKHILPNMLGPLIVIAVSNFASAIIVESGLSYLGFGIQPPMPSLGSILSENYGFILSGKPMLAIAPVMALLILVLAFNLTGNGIRDIFDVKSNLAA